MREKEGDSRFGLMALYTRAIGETIEQMEREGSSTQTEMSTKVIGPTTKLKAMVCILIKTGLNTRAIGRKTNSTEREKRPGLMEPCIKETMSMGRNMA